MRINVSIFDINYVIDIKHLELRHRHLETRLNFSWSNHAENTFIVPRIPRSDACDNTIERPVNKSTINMKLKTSSVTSIQPRIGFLE